MKFDKAVIYRIVCKDPEITDAYVGSTTNFVKRKCQHKSICNNEKVREYNFYVYKFIRDNGGWENWEMLEVCKASQCTTKQELLKLEREHIEGLKPTLNKSVPTRTLQEYREQNREKIKEYREQNKDKMKIFNLQYYEQNKDKIKAYCEQNKEIINNRNKFYYEQNKDSISTRRRELRRLKK